MMNNNDCAGVIGNTSGHSRRQFLGGAVAAVAAGALLETAATFAAEAPGESETLDRHGHGDITPPLPVALMGFQTVRLTHTIQTPLTVNVLALESPKAIGRSTRRFLSPVILRFTPGIQEGFRKHVAARLPGFNVNKLFLAATHTHSPPVLQQDAYDEKTYGDAMQPKDYVPWLYQRMADAVVRAWESRAAGAVAWGLGHAVVGQNRRVVDADGHAAMSNNASDPKFRHIEGYEDHGVDILCFYNEEEAAQGDGHRRGVSGPDVAKRRVVGADSGIYATQSRSGSGTARNWACSASAPAGDQCPT